MSADVRQNKIKVMFVCHGNICRSPMAEFVFKDLVKKQKIDHKFLIESSATSLEEIGNDVHRGTKQILAQKGVECTKRSAKRINRDDMQSFDFVIVMEEYNLTNLSRLFDLSIFNNVFKLLDFAGGGDIDDPWYTGDFATTYDQVVSGCQGLLEHIKTLKMF